jgi:hypothetical protein
MRNFAQRLIANETSEVKCSATNTPAAFQVCEKLRAHLATLMGNAGFAALLSRALALANAEVPWLRAVRVEANGTWGGLAELPAQLDPAVYSEGGETLVAHLLGLLVAFIGEDVTLRLAREIWPEIPLSGLDFGKGGDHEETA